MVAHVLRLRFALLVGALRGDRGGIIRTVIAAVLFIAAVVAACVGVLMLRAQEPDAAYVVTVLAGSGLLLGVTIAPLIAGTVDQLDPRRFVLFGMEPSSLAGGLALASLVSVPSLGLIAGVASMTVLWTSQGVPAIVAILCAVIAVATCLLLARVSMALAALVLRQRRSRELSGLFALGLVVVVVPVVIFIASLEWRGRVPSQLDAAADVLALTPFGAVWAIPSLTLGDDVALLVWAWIIAVVTLIAVAGGFLLVVRRMLSTVEAPSAGPGRGGLGWFAVAPGTPAGAIAARGIVYWMKDRRYIVNVAIVPFAALIAALPLLVAGVPPQTVALIPVLIMALFLGWIPHNDTAYDSTAVWMHVVAGVRGISDRFGRLIPITLVAVPLLAIVIPVSVALYDRWAVLPAVVGVCASLFLSGLGLSSIASAVAPYAVTRPGDSPFLQPQRAGSGVASQALVLVGALVASAATLFWAWQTITDDIETATTTMWVGLGTGFGVLLAGLLIGAFAFEARATRLMEFAESN